jgi:hypothetical protein
VEFISYSGYEIFFMITFLRPSELITWTPLYEAWNFHRVDLIHILKRLGDEKSAQHPEDGSWSSMEVADHLRITQELFVKLLSLVSGGKRGERKNDIKVDYDSIERDYSGPGKFKNPDAVTPSKEINRVELIKSLNSAMEKVEESLMKIPMEDLQTIYFEHPLCGMISMLDWLWVLTLHEGMHIEALKNKLEKMGADHSHKLLNLKADENADGFH